MSGLHIKPGASGDASEAQSWKNHDPRKHFLHSWCDSIVLGQCFNPACSEGNEEKRKGTPAQLGKKPDVPEHLAVNRTAKLQAEERQVIYIKKRGPLF